MSLDDTVRALVDERVREILAVEFARREGERPASVPADDGERLLSVAHVAERTARSEATVRRWIADGVLPTVSVPGRVKGKEITCVRESDLDRWIRSLPVRCDHLDGQHVGMERVRRQPATTRRPTAGRAPVSGLEAEIQKLHAKRGVGRSTRHRQGAAL